MTRNWYEELLQAPATPREPRADRPNVTASEVGNYMYCGRSWWLRSQSGPPSESVPLLEDGHRRHAAAARGSEEAEHTMGVLRWAGMLAAVLAACAIGAFLALR